MSKGPLDVLVDNARFLVRPVFPSAEQIHFDLLKEVQGCAEVFYRTGRESIIPSEGAISPRDFVLERYAADNPLIDINELEKRTDRVAFSAFKRITKKYLFGGSMGPPVKISGEERYVLAGLSKQPGEYLRRPEIVSFISARCLAGDVAFFKRLGSVLASSKNRTFDPFHKLDYAIARYWTHPLMPLWMMTDNAASMALSVVIQRTVQKQTYKKARRTLGLRPFPKQAIREVKIFKNHEMRYVYSSWAKLKSKKRDTT